MNYLLLMIIIVFIWRMVSGYKKGMVKELQAFVTLIVASVSIGLICKIINAYRETDKISMIIAILLLVILGICYKILSLVFFSAKAIVKLPIIHLADKLMGIVMGAAEVLVVLWAFYFVIDTFPLGIFGKVIAAYIRDSRFLMYLYENNLLGKIFEQLRLAVSRAV